MIHCVQIVGSLAPETGGTARSASLLSQGLAENNCRVSLISFDLGPEFSKPLLPLHPLLDVYILSNVLSLGMKPLLTPELPGLLKNLIESNPDTVIHVQGVWLPYLGIASHFAARKSIPLVVSPRGMLTPWAMQYRSLRKKIAWLLYQKRWIKRANMIHCTGEEEARQVSALGIMQPKVITPNGTVIPDKINRRSTDQEKTILFLSRIHPKKGLLNLVDALAGIDLKGWKVILVGYDEGNYRAVVEQAVEKEDLSSKVIFQGPVEDSEKWQVYRNADLFVLPSHSENFGIVVAEALAAGLPVITTTGTPWQDLERCGCGWWVEPEVSEIRKALNEALALTDEERWAMGKKGRELVKDQYSWKSIGAQMKNSYYQLLGKESS